MAGKNILIWGAGRIGRGFVADLFNAAGYRIILVDQSLELITQLRQAGRYTVVRAESAEKRRDQIITGYSALAYDFRNHGESDTGTCEWVTWGPEEHKDVLAAVEFVSTHPTYSNSNIGLLSICMGAASSTYAFGTPNGLADNDRIKAMVAIQPLRYPDFMKALRLDNFVGRWVTNRNNERTGIDLDAVTFMADVASVSNAARTYSFGAASARQNVLGPTRAAVVGPMRTTRPSRMGQPASVVFRYCQCCRSSVKHHRGKVPLSWWS